MSFTASPQSAPGVGNARTRAIHEPRKHRVAGASRPLDASGQMVTILFGGISNYRYDPDQKLTDKNAPVAYSSVIVGGLMPTPTALPRVNESVSLKSAEPNSDHRSKSRCRLSVRSCCRMNSRVSGT